jgi:hypothetical protein
VETSCLSERKKSPVFVVGCHRSGTNLLYDILLSSGDFAVYRGLLPIYDKLIPHCGRLDRAGNRKTAVDLFLRSNAFRRSGLEAGQLASSLLSECQTGGDFIRIVMEAVARGQSASRWAVYNPDNLLRIRRIKREIPNALFIHIIRDGRDIALSLNKMGGFAPLPWDRAASRAVLVTALYWQWMLHQGRRQGRHLDEDYYEIHYEELVSDPESTLSKLGQFLEHEFDYKRIQNRALGRLRESNSSFRGEQTSVNPVNRWKDTLSRTQVRAIEAMVGDCLRACGYPLVTSESERHPGLRERWMRRLYSGYLSTKLWLKTSTPAGRFSNMSLLDLQPFEPENY